MGKIRIQLDTLTDVQKFTAAMSTVTGEVYLIDGNHKFKVNGKSILATLLAQAEWQETWVQSDEDIYEKLRPWVVV